MDTIAQQYFVKLSELPDDVQYYFDSEISGKFMKELEEKYKMPRGSLADLATDVIVNDFHFEVIVEKIKEYFKYDKEKAKNFIIDFFGVVLFPVHEQLKEINIDIAGEIIKRGGLVEPYRKYEEEFLDVLGDELIQNIDEFAFKQKDVVDFDKEKITSLNILEKNFLKVLEIDNINLLDLLNHGLLAVLHNVQGFQKEAVDALLRNQEQLTIKEFFLGNKAEKPTIGNWLKDFISQYGSGDFDSLILSEYVATSTNSRKLDAREKNLLEKLIIVYHNLKFFAPSEEIISPEQLFIIPISATDEEPIKSKGDIMKKFYEKPEDSGSGVSEKKPAASSDNEVTSQILDAYRGDIKLDMKVSEEILNMKKKFGNDKKFVREAFFDAVRNSNIPNAIAALRILAEMGYIENILKEDEKLNKFLAATWEKVHGKEAAQEFRKDPGTPKFMKMFLQYVLEERLKMKKGDAARVGAQLGSLYKKQGKPEYSKLAYFDMEHKEFRWMQ